MSTYIQDEIPTIMANFTCITGNCSHLESTSVTTSSEAPFEDEPEAVPYTTIQAILIGMASGLLSLVTIVGKLQKIIRESSWFYCWKSLTLNFAAFVQSFAASVQRTICKEIFVSTKCAKFYHLRFYIATQSMVLFICRNLSLIKLLRFKFIHWLHWRISRLLRLMVLSDL